MQLLTGAWHAARRPRSPAHRTAARGRKARLERLSTALSLNLALLLAGVVLSGVVLFWQPAGELASSFPFIFGGWFDAGVTEWILIALLAVLVVGIGMGLAGAYQSARPSTVATFDYSYLIFMVLWDYLFFSTAPSVTTVFGMLLIITAGFLVIRRR